MCGISQQHFHGGSQVTQVQWWHLPQAWGVQQARSCRARGNPLLPGRLLLRDSTSKQCLDHRHHFGLAGSSVLERQQGFREVTCPLSLSPLPRTRVILSLWMPSAPKSGLCQPSLGWRELRLFWQGIDQASLQHRGEPVQNTLPASGCGWTAMPSMNCSNSSSKGAGSFKFQAQGHL